MQDDAIFINVGRGETVDQDALQEALENSLAAQGPTTGKSGTLRILGAALECVCRSLSLLLESS